MLQADLNERAAGALEQAMKRMGIRHATDLAVRLSSVVSNGPSASTCLRWIKREQAVPAWALLATAQAAGTTLDALLGGLETRHLIEEFEDLKRRLARLEAPDRDRAAD